MLQTTVLVVDSIVARMPIKWETQPGIKVDPKELK